MASSTSTSTMALSVETNSSAVMANKTIAIDVTLSTAVVGGTSIAVFLAIVVYAGLSMPW